MALLSIKGMMFSALLLLLGSNIVVLAEEALADDDEAIVEVEEENYVSPKIDSKNIYFSENFDDEAAVKKRWIKSEAKKQGVAEEIAKYDGQWQITSPTRKIFKEDLGLVLTTEAKHAAISSLLDKPFVFKDKPLVVQYEVTMQEGQDCGGAYIKLLSQGTNTKDDLRKFHDQTAYTIMFGPDKCGTDTKLHFIFRHKNPMNGSYEEKHSKKPSERLDDIFKDKEPHLYTLIVRPDNTYSVLVDRKPVISGTLMEDFTPPVNPPREIDDPTDTKPKDWDEREKIADPAAVKPDEWDEDAPAQVPDETAVKPDGWLDDEPLVVPDPEAVKPADWDEEMDGSWEAPLVDNPVCARAAGCGPWVRPSVDNPDYKGKWYPPQIPNPNYQGKWRPRKVPNPDYFQDDAPFRMTTINAIGFELWSMSPRLLFDNILVADDELVAERWAELSFARKRDRLHLDSESVVDRAVGFMKDNPWMYGVIVLVLLIFIVVFMYLRSSDEEPSDASAKKTDAVSPDDEQEPEEEEEEEVKATGKAGLEKQDHDGQVNEKSVEVDSCLTKNKLDEGTDEKLRQRKKADSSGGSGDAANKED